MPSSRLAWLQHRQPHRPPGHQALLLIANLNVPEMEGAAQVDRHRDPGDRATADRAQEAGVVLDAGGAAALVKVGERARQGERLADGAVAPAVNDPEGLQMPGLDLEAAHDAV